MVKKIFLKSDNRELLFPVTPESFSVASGLNVQSVHIQTIGDVAIPGEAAGQQIRLEVMLPGREYPFSFGTAAPYDYINQLESWIQNKTRLRFIVSETEVNRPVFVEEVSYGEKDGSGDVYATVRLREYKELKATAVQQKTENKDRESEYSGLGDIQSYTIKSGDTLWDIARRFYGDGGKCYKLASYNGIANAALIYAGTVIKIPPAGVLK